MELKIRTEQKRAEGVIPGKDRDLKRPDICRQKSTPSQGAQAQTECEGVNKNSKAAEQGK